MTANSLFVATPAPPPHPPKFGLHGYIPPARLMGPRRVVDAAEYLIAMPSTDDSSV